MVTCYQKKYLLILLFGLALSACHPSTKTKSKVESLNNEIGEIQKTDTQISEQVFKEWLVDTLQKLNSENNKSPRSKVIIVAEDSSQLNIYEGHKFFFGNSQVSKDKMIKNVIDLLKEYKELPLSKYELKFKTNYFYTPSFLSNLKYNVIFELQDIEIIEDSTISKYEYIRGRLSRKVVTYKEHNSKEQFEFIWKNDKLFKKKVI